MAPLYSLVDGFDGLDMKDKRCCQKDGAKHQQFQCSEGNLARENYWAPPSTDALVTFCSQFAARAEIEAHIATDSWWIDMCKKLRPTTELQLNRFLL